MDIMSTHTELTTCTETCGSQTDQEERISRKIFPAVTGEDRSSSEADQLADQGCIATIPAGKSVDWSDLVDGQQSEEDIMQISGAGHWFLEGWIGDHAVDFLVDSGSAVTAVSRPFFDRLSEAGAPVSLLRYHWNRHGGIGIASHLGHKEWIAVHRRRSVTSTT